MNKSAKILSLVVVIVFALAIAPAKSQLDHLIIPAIDGLAWGWKKATEKSEQEKPEWQKLVENQYKKIGVKLRFGEPIDNIQYSQINRVLVCQADINNEKGAIFVGANSSGKYLGSVTYDKPVMNKFENIMKMEESLKKNQLRNIFLQYAKVDLGPYDREEKEGSDIEDKEESKTENKEDNDTELKLTKLKSLFDKGLITQEEYDKKKAELLSDL